MKYIPADKLKAQIQFLIDNGYDNLQGNLYHVLSIIDSLLQEQSDAGLFECPKTPIPEAVDVTSRMRYIDDDLKPIANFIMEYASWNLHKDEWNQPVIEVPLFRVLDALVQRGKPYCEG